MYIWVSFSLISTHLASRNCSHSLLAVFAHVCVCGSYAHMCMSVWRPEDNLGRYLSGVIHLLERVSHWSGICQVVLAGLLESPRDQPGSASQAPGSQKCDTMPTIFFNVSPGDWLQDPVPARSLTTLVPEPSAQLCLNPFANSLLPSRWLFLQGFTLA